MVHCDNCLTNVAGLCPHCRSCCICCEENNCFDCREISEIREMLKTKEDCKLFLEMLFK